MDLELDLDDELVAAIEDLATRAGISAEEWARLAIRSYLGLALTAAETASLRPPAPPGIEETPQV